MLGKIAKKIFGTKNQRVIKSLEPLVRRIGELESQVSSLTDTQIADRTIAFKQRVQNGESLDQILPEAFATVREAGKRVLNMRHFDMQLVGGMVLHHGMIAEMKTGEGKTLVATLAAYLNSLAGKGVHIVTVNDYLARRDSEWMGRIYKFLGLDVGVVYSGVDEKVKQAAYKADITYGQNNEFGFDYLRDNMKFSLDDQLQRGHFFAIVDEVDSILIDEARTPLIISGPAEDSTDKYYVINKIIPYLKLTEHFEMDVRTKQPTLTELGISRTEELLDVENLYDPNNIEILHHVTQALRAYTTMERDVDYVVSSGQVVIVDEFTGRLMPGRRWSNGLHQAIEAKEGLKVAREFQTLASVTFQNYFRLYNKLSGMTGTADTEAVELKEIYKLDVVLVPPNRPMIRADESDQVFRTRREKYEAAAKDIVEINKVGQPVLVGTISIEQSEALSQVLKEKGVVHNVLNAKHHEREAEIIAQAGRFNAVTISTNMAGRGTDILLGGNPEFLAFAEAGTRDREDPKFKELLTKYTEVCADERQKVIDVGGLFILGTERHESRRIDNQLRGRAGRQGDPGRSRFYVSLEDDLMRRFAGDKVQALMVRLGWEEGLAMEGSWVSKSVETAQKRVEAFHFDSRKHVTEYDDVMNKQRQVVYALRTKVLAHQGVKDELREWITDLLEESVVSICDEKTKAVKWEIGTLKERYATLLGQQPELPQDLVLDQQVIFDLLKDSAFGLYEQRLAELEGKLVRLHEIFENKGNPFDFSTDEVEQDIIIRTLDHLWNQHLQEIDHLREGIGLRGWGQKNPLHEYQKEGFHLFQQLMGSLKETVVRQVFHYHLPEPAEYIAHLEAEQKRREAIEKQITLQHPDGGAASESDSGTAQPIQSPNNVVGDGRARLIAQRKARRRDKR